MSLTRDKFTKTAIPASPVHEALICTICKNCLMSIYAYKDVPDVWYHMSNNNMFCEVRN